MGYYDGPYGAWVGRFTVSGCHESVTLNTTPFSTDIGVLPPPGTYLFGMQFLLPGAYGQVFTGPGLTLPTGNADPSDTDINQVVNQLYEQSVLQITPTGTDTQLLYPHQYPQFSSQDSFFEQDGQKTFFITPATWQIYFPWHRNTGSFANFTAPVRFYATSFLPALNVTGVTPRLLAAAPLIAKLDILPSGVLTWGGEWIGDSPILLGGTAYNYAPFQHPFVCDFIRALKRYGIDGLLKWPAPSSAIPNWPTPPTPTPLQLEYSDYFNGEYEPQDVNTPYPTDEVDFSYSGAYSQYNWELFFHAPLLLATSLSQNQQFDKAQQWLHYIIDPTDLYPVPPPNEATNFPYGFWKVKPFYEQTTQTTIADLITLLDANQPGNAGAVANFQQQVAASMNDPFNPFAIARLRTSAFQKTAVMKYLDNLIAWGDNLFTQDTRESINEATQLYLLAEQLLGPRPQQVPRADTAAQSYAQLAPNLVADDLADPLVQIENALPVSPGQLVPPTPLPYAPTALSSALYFCVPPNPQLLAYWDTIADRLYKIRNCQNIKGQFQQLPLLAPPIPPGLLVQAVAGGVDLSSVLSAISAPPPLYHFPYLYKQAIDFSKEVQTLGSMLLTALEKDDAENLAALRAIQEASLLAQMRQEYLQRLTLAQQEQTIDLPLYQQRVQDRLTWYTSQPFAYDAESSGQTNRVEAMVIQAVAAVTDLAVGVFNLIPDIHGGATGCGGSPTVKFKFGGNNLAASLKGYSDSTKTIANIAKEGGDIALTKGHFQDRQARYQLQATLAQDELNEITKAKLPMAAVKTVLALSQLQDHDTKTQNAQNVAAFLQTKFTNQQLYDWMTAQISGVYFQAYQLAYQMAKRAEVSYNRDLGNYDANYLSFIQPSYWDNLHQGLLAAVPLMSDLERMQSSFVDNNFREFEITRPISLSTLDKNAFNTLITTGTAFFDTLESLFDLDYPGHYMRRIKYAGLIFTFSGKTRPAYINCTLTLQSSSIRISPTATNPYGRTGVNDARFHDLNQVQSIVTSNGGIASSSGTSADNGMFETTVHYIITDDRYLTFEHSGVIGHWQLELTKKANPLVDLTTITDIALQLEYNSRYGGDALKKLAGG